MARGRAGLRLALQPDVYPSSVQPLRYSFLRHAWAAGWSVTLPAFPSQVIFRPVRNATRPSRFCSIMLAPYSKSHDVLSAAFLQASNHRSVDESISDLTTSSRRPTLPRMPPSTPIRNLKSCAWNLKTITQLGLLFGAFLSLATPTTFAAATTVGSGRDRPNIILIMADDLGFSDVGCYGSEIETPNIDALAKRGVRFTQFYNGAVCCPTRAALLTGLYAHQAGVGWMVNHGADTRPPGPYQGFLNDRCVTLAEVLRSAGYRTLMSGKWHVGESRPHWPVDRGFDRYFGLISGAANYFDPTKSVRKGVVRQFALDGEPWQPPREGFFLTDAITEHAVDFLGKEGRGPNPFFLYVAFTAPHTPLQAPAEDIAKYRGKYRQGWDALREGRLQRMKAAGLMEASVKLSPRDPNVPAWSTVAEPDLMDLKMAIYAAQISRMDRGIGRILARLREIGQEQNTLVLFLSDNGGSSSENISDRAEKFNRAPYLGGPDSYTSYGRPWANASNTPLRKFKAGLYEGGIRAPMIAVWPGMVAQPGGFCPAPVHIIDYMSTFVEISGARYPNRINGREIHPMEGTSFLPLLKGSRTERRAPLFWELEGNRAMRDGAWKLVAEPGKAWELYDLLRDPTELQNLAREKPALVDEMAAQYANWATRCGVLPWEKISSSMQNLPPPPPK